MTHKNTYGHSNSSNIYAKATKYLNSPISVIKLAEKDIENGRKRFANASDYVETWHDSDSIYGCKCSKRFETSCKNGGITTQNHNINILRPVMNIWK